LKTKRKKKKNNLTARLLRLLKGITIFFGLLFLSMIVLSFTALPWHAYHRLGTKLVSKQNQNPDCIILLGAGGIPGAEGLLRTWYTIEAAGKFPSSEIIVALPADTTDFEASDHKRIIQQLTNAGVEAKRILSETRGTNTREQSVFIFKMLAQKKANLLIVTSPEHMYRSILTFRKTGFENVNGLPTFENSFDEELLISEEGTQGKKENKSGNLGLRYNMWSYLQYEIKVSREYIALAYYKLKGYI